ncbi:hypothetical protein ACLOJK_019908 [Asimina triloba]
MLSKSFKAGKCKIALKLAASRIKLLKNKREVQLKQMKRDLAQLLESGQEKTAMIRTQKTNNHEEFATWPVKTGRSRKACKEGGTQEANLEVEHVLREEKTMAAYDIIQLYCELIVARLPIIESQKSCPIDLKEAISSIIFAAPRCADIVELQDAKKHFTAKYGKEFVNAALELRTDCGVSRTVIEKLSAKTPDGETKIRILAAIAEEHNVTWDRASLEEQVLKPPEDLLHGPSKFVSASTMRVESPSQFQPISQMHKPSTTSIKNDVISSSLSSANVSSADMSTTSIPTVHPDLRTSERTSRAGEDRDPFYNNVTDSNRQGWTMEFKDATSAAQAAAESAERASMAARAAAELSRRSFKKEYATGSHGVSSFGPREHEETGSRLKAEHDANLGRMEYDPRGGYHGRSSPPQAMNRQRSEPEDDLLLRAAENRYHSHGSVERTGTQLTSSQSSMASIHEESWTGNRKVDEFPQDRSTEINENQQSKNVVKEEFHGGVRANKQPSRSASSNSSVGSIDDDISLFSHRERGSGHEGFSAVGSAKENQWREEAKKHDVLGVENFQNQPGQFAFSASNMDPVVGDAVWVKNFHDFEVDADHSSGSMMHGKAQMNSGQPGQSNNPTAVFDDSGSDSDSQLEFESHTDRHEFDSYFSPGGRKSPSRFLPNADPWSPMQKPGGYQQKESSGMDSDFATVPQPSALFSGGIAGTTVRTESSDQLPVTFDESDGPASENEEEDFNIKDRSSKSSGKADNLSVHKKNGTTGSDRRSLSHAPYDLELEETRSEIDQKADLNSGFQHYLSLGGERESSQKSTDLESKPFYSSNVGKQWQRQSSEFSLSEGVQEDFSTPVLTTSAKDLDFSNNLSNESGGELNLGRLSGGLRNRNTRPPYVRGQNGDDLHPSKQPSVDEAPAVVETTIDALSEKASANSDTLHHERHGPKQSVNIQKETKSSRRTFFDSDSDDAEEIPPHRTVESSGYRGSPKLSRRTRDPPKHSAMGGPSRLTGRSEVSTSSDVGGGSKLSAQSSSGDPLSRLPSHMLRPNSFPERPPRELRQTETSVQRESVKSSRPTLPFEQPSEYGSSNSTSGSSSGSKLSSSTAGSVSTVSSKQGASHVHPKLPDYDSLAAHLESLRSDRRSR